jgi:hypothetical protein
MTTSTCGCVREDAVFLPCPIHKQMMDDANGLTAAIVNHQRAAVIEECAKIAEDAWNTASDQVNAKAHAAGIARAIRLMGKRV